RQRRLAEELQLQEARLSLDVLVLAQRLLRLALNAELGDAGVDGTGLRAGDAEFGFRAGGIEDAEEVGRVSRLLEHGRSPAARDGGLFAQRHLEQHLRAE